MKQQPKSRESADQRKALNESEKKASKPLPESYPQRETEDKIVEVRRIDRKDSAIKGIDPK
jgi:hypothetical protein